MFATNVLCAFAATDLLEKLSGLGDVLGYAGLFILVILVAAYMTVRYIPNNYVGVVEKLWSTNGSVGEGSIIALKGEAGFQAHLLRGGLHFGFWRGQYRIHKVRLGTVPQGENGYGDARGREPAPPSHTPG